MAISTILLIAVAVWIALILYRVGVYRPDHGSHRKAAQAQVAVSHLNPEDRGHAKLRGQVGDDQPPSPS